VFCSGCLETAGPSGYLRVHKNTTGNQSSRSSVVAIAIEPPRLLDPLSFQKYPRFPSWHTSILACSHALLDVAIATSTPRRSIPFPLNSQNLLLLYLPSLPHHRLFDMSSDILAEFDSFYKTPQHAPSSSTPASDDLSILGSNHTKGNGQSAQGGAVQSWSSSSAQPVEDIWGSLANFHPAANNKPAAIQNSGIWSSFGSTGLGTGQLPPTPAYGGATTVRCTDGRGDMGQGTPGIIRGPTLDLFAPSALQTAEFRPTSLPHEKYVPPVITKNPTITKNPYGDVLFDADEIGAMDGDDDFGEFESVTPVTPAQPSKAAILSSTSQDFMSARTSTDLLWSLSALNKKSPHLQASRSPSFKEIKILAEPGLSKSQVSTAKNNGKLKPSSPLTSWPTYKPEVSKSKLQPDEDWGDFADFPTNTPDLPSAKTGTGVEADGWCWDKVDQIMEAAPVEAADVPPPANIPPPSVLLTLFPNLFDLPQSTLFNPVASQPFSLKNRIISDPNTIQFLRGYLLIAVVAARVIAGRKLRWKRDTLLSQAMKIGPAAAGGKGGMKLTGIDKAEASREDREAADVVRIWKDQVGRLRSAVAIANSSMHNTTEHLAIPDLSETMYVKTHAGGQIARKPCVVCGLRREERINKVDIDVEDSFGEWWTEHWGHRACKNFWLKHEPILTQR
jgi:hypothetical protein